VGAHTKRAASVVLAVVLSGTPALLAACAMLCEPAGHAAHRSRPQDAPSHSACCVTERATAPAGHAHHATPDHGAASPVAPDVAAHMTSAVASCCGDGLGVAVAAAAITRVDTGLLVAPPIAALAVTVARPAPTTAGVGRLHSPRRSPARPPLVLRI
jgi:hypothetical protein